MSVEMLVFLDSRSMPTPERWAAAIRESEFDMVLDTDFDVTSFTGFLPCKYKGSDAGFEYFFDRLADMEPEPDLVTRIGVRDVAVSFITHYDVRELMTSIIASGVLCSITDGVLLDTEANKFVDASNAIQWSKTSEGEIASDL